FRSWFGGVCLVLAQRWISTSSGEGRSSALGWLRAVIARHCDQSCLLTGRDQERDRLCHGRISWFHYLDSNSRRRRVFRHGADPGESGPLPARSAGTFFLGLGILERTRTCRRLGQLQHLFARAAAAAAVGRLRVA